MRGALYFLLYSLRGLLILSSFVVFITEKSNSQGFLKAGIRSTNCEVSSHEADRWYFGQNAAMDFRPEITRADLSNTQLNVPTSPAIMADSTGEILFYTDGAKVYNRYEAVMPNGDGLHGYVGYTMPVIILPKPGSDSIYYIFTTNACLEDPDDPRTIYGFEYSEVRMNRENGAGDVTLKNKQLLPPEVSSKLTAVQHENGIDYWVVTHRFDSKEFCAFRVTSNGVDTSGNFTSSIIGSKHIAPDSTNNAKGYMKASPDGTKIALAIYGSGIIEIFDFDAGNGTLGSAITSAPVFDAAYGIEFSSDSRFLYASTTPASPPQPSYLFQFDTYKGSSIFDPGEFDTIATDILGSNFAGMQLGTDGKIYVARSPSGNASLSVILNPKRPGPDCNFQTNALDLEGRRNRLGLPNFMQSYFDLPHFDVEKICYADTTYFFLQNESNVTDASWEFTDTNTVTLTGKNPWYVFSRPGEYEVSVTESYNGESFGPYTETVTVNDLPVVDLRDTVYMYPGAPIILDAGAGFTSYEWSTGEITQQVIVSDTGTYYVKVQNELCCFNSDYAVVMFFDVFVPNAFRPGGKNKIFKAYTSSPEAVTNFTMYIFNRWGQQVYVIRDINDGWDGRINGQDAPGDVYVWMVNYDIERKGKAEKLTYKGNVILLR